MWKPGEEDRRYPQSLPRLASTWPVLVIELKWNKDAEGAIDQILEKKYPTVLGFSGKPILLVGISYDKDKSVGERCHTCRILDYIPEK